MPIFIVNILGCTVVALLINVMVFAMTLSVDMIVGYLILTIFVYVTARVLLTKN